MKVIKKANHTACFNHSRPSQYLAGFAMKSIILVLLFLCVFKQAQSQEDTTNAGEPSGGEPSDTAAEPTTAAGENEDGEKKEENGGEAEKTEKTEAIEEAMVTLGAEDEPPEHVMTDRYGFPLTDASTLQYNLSDGQVRVYTQYWCLCLTRGPLPLFKLIGNLHFKHIKGNRRRSSTTESGSTICPPCDCATCFTTEGTTERRNKLC